MIIYRSENLYNFVIRGICTNVFVFRAVIFYRPRAWQAKVRVVTDFGIAAVALEASSKIIPILRISAVVKYIGALLN